MDKTKREGNITMSMVMLPWLAHGHIFPFLELAKKLTHRNFIIYLCSTPITLNSIKKSIIDHNYYYHSVSIKLVELHLPSLPHLPPHYHTTNGLPHNLTLTLKHAYDLSSPAFAEILTTIKPDLLLYDFNQPWAASIASSLNIPAVQFLTGSACFNAFALHMLYKAGETFPYPNLWPYGHGIGGEPIDFTQIPENDKKDVGRFLGALQGSRDIILCKTFKEIEGKYIDYLSVLSSKKIVPVGPLVHDDTIKEEDDDDDDQHKEIIEWLDKKEENSVVFVSFGSEYFLSKEEIEEIANGLELSKVNFIWVVRFPVGERIEIKEALPENFLERVGERGMVVEGWAPQAKILGRKSTGGFVSHCGWSSVMEGMKFGVPIIAMPMHLDQPINAKLVVEVGVGVEVVRDENGKLEREKVAAVIKQVVVDKTGVVVRKKARDLSEKIAIKGEEEIDRRVVEELLQLCGKSK